jgi:hypothetical protein
MSITADHVVGQKITFRIESRVDLLEKKFKFDEVMQRLDGQNYIVRM